MNTLRHALSIGMLITNIATATDDHAEIFPTRNTEELFASIVRRELHEFGNQSPNIIIPDGCKESKLKSVLDARYANLGLNKISGKKLLPLTGISGKELLAMLQPTPILSREEWMLLSGAVSEAKELAGLDSSAFGGIPGPDGKKVLYMKDEQGIGRPVTLKRITTADPEFKRQMAKFILQNPDYISTYQVEGKTRVRLNGAVDWETTPETLNVWVGDEKKQQEEIIQKIIEKKAKSAPPGSK